MESFGGSLGIFVGVAGFGWFEHVSAERNFSFPAGVQVRSVGNVRPRTKTSIFCSVDVDFGGEHAPASQNLRFFGRRVSIPAR